MKKMNRFKLSIFLLPAYLFSALPAYSADSLTVSNWGGSYIKAQRQAYLDPFSQSTGIDLALKDYSGGFATLRDANEDPQHNFDVIDMLEFEALLACEDGLLVKFDRFDRSLLNPAPNGESAGKDFVDEAILDCGIAHLEFATVLAYNDRNFPDEKPTSIRDFFDLEKFPGKRAIHKSPHAILEWALMSYGVPSQQIYDLLSTQRGLDLVARRLNQIRDHIVWWEDASEPVSMLENGTVTMASGYSGRFFSARVNDDIPISTLQEGQLLEFSVWVIPQNTANLDNARRFIKFVTSTKAMAAMGNLLPYAPTRNSALQRIGIHSNSNVSIRAYMTSSKTQGAIRANSQWYAETEQVREKWFNEWIESD